MTKLFKEDLIHDKDKLELYNTNPRVNTDKKTTCVVINGKVQEDYSYELLQNCMKEREKDINNNNNNNNIRDINNNYYISSSKVRVGYNKENEEEKKRSSNNKTKGASISDSEMDLLNGLNEDVAKLSNGHIPLSPFSCNIRLYTKKSIKDGGPKCGRNHNELDFDPKEQIKVIKSEFDPIKSFQDQLRNSVGDEIDHKVLNSVETTNQQATNSESFPTTLYKQNIHNAQPDIQKQDEPVARKTKQSSISVKLKRSKSDVGRKTPTFDHHEKKDDARHSDAETDDFLNRRLDIRQKYQNNRSHNDIARKEKENEHVVRFAQPEQRQPSYNGPDYRQPSYNGSEQRQPSYNGCIKRNTNSYYSYVHDKIAHAKEEEWARIDSHPYRKQNYVPDYSFDYHKINKPLKSNLARSKSLVGAKEFNPPPRLRFKEDKSIDALSLESPDLNEDKRTMLQNEFSDRIPNCSTDNYKNGNNVNDDIDLKKQMNSIRSRYRHEHEHDTKKELDNKYADEVFIDTNSESSESKYGSERKGSLNSPSRYRALSNTGKDYDAYIRSMKLYKLNPSISDDDEKQVRKIHCTYGEKLNKEKAVPRTVDFVYTGNEGYDYDGEFFTRRPRFKSSSHPSSGHTSDSEEVPFSRDFKNIKTTIKRELTGKFTESYPYLPREHRRNSTKSTTTSSDDGDEPTTKEVHHYYYKKSIDDSINTILNTIDDKKDADGNNVLRNILFTDFPKNSKGDNKNKSSNSYGNIRVASHARNIMNQNGDRNNSSYGDNPTDAYEARIRNRSYGVDRNTDHDENNDLNDYAVDEKVEIPNNYFTDNRKAPSYGDNPSGAYEARIRSISYGDDKNTKQAENDLYMNSLEEKNTAPVEIPDNYFKDNRKAPSYGDNSSCAYEARIISRSNGDNKNTNKAENDIYSYPSEEKISAPVEIPNNYFKDNRNNTSYGDNPTDAYEARIKKNSYGDNIFVNKPSENKHYDYDDKKTKNNERKNTSNELPTKKEGHDVKTKAKYDDKDEIDGEVSSIPEIFIRRKSLDKKYNEFNDTVDSLNTSIEEFITSLSK